MNLLFFKKSQKASAKNETTQGAPPPVPPPNTENQPLVFKPRVISGVKPTDTATCAPAATGSFETKTERISPQASSNVSTRERAVTEVKVTLETVLDCLPRDLMKPTSALVDLSMPVSLPSELVMSQLATGRITMRLAELISKLPKEILADPLPQVGDRDVDLPLHKVIPQLPPSIFAPRGDQQVLTIDEEFIPTPFGLDPAAKALAQTTESVLPTTVEAAPKASQCSTPPQATQVAKPIIVTVEPVRAPAPKETTGAAPADKARVDTEQREVASVPAEKTAQLLDHRQFLININTCSVEELNKIPGIGPSLAQRIIAFREAHGPITDINQLRQIPGVGNKTFRRIIGAQPSRVKVERLVNYLLDVPQDRELTVQEIVQRTAQLPGVQGCILASDDGLFVTGQLPPPLDTQTVSAFASQLFRRVSRYVRELQAGHVRRFSLFTDKQPVSIFHAGRIYLVVIHAPDRFSKALLRKCDRIAQEINRLCTERLSL